MLEGAPASDAAPAVSSTAPDASTNAPDADPLESLSEPQLLEWRTSGKMPPASSVTTPPAAPSAATPGPAQAASTDARSQSADSEPAAPAKGAEARIPQLLSERARERERADRAERRLAELERATFQPAAPKPGARPAASPAAPASDGKPDPETFTYGTSDPEYLEALTAYKVNATLAGERRQAQIREEGQRVISAFESRAEAARAKYQDFDAVAMLAPTEIPQGSAIDLFVLEDPAGADILYHLQQPANAGERRRILKLSPLDQLKTLVRLGDRLTGAPAGARSTNAPAPPVVLSSRGTPGDPVERALAADDTGAYIAEMNRRELAARLKR
jgi:hypothetical protein